MAGFAPGILRPSYPAEALSPGIVHIGLGNFHRAHQAWYLHRLMQQGQALDWAILGAGVRPADIQMRQRLLTQDCLSTLICLDPEGRSAEIIGAMQDFLPVDPEGPGPHGALIAAMADPRIRIVSLTVTEGGYFLDPATGALDTEHADIRHDGANPQAPRTAFGAMLAALTLRRAAGHPPFTAQSCDNLQGNGDILRGVLVGLARLADPGLAAWLEAEGAFPNSMVDCIVPATGAAELTLARDFGIEDAAPVTHEAFRQWVIEDRFAAGRPPWEAVGATLTADVHRYEAMKIRMLNGGHQVLANAGELLGLETIAECATHASIAALFDRVQREEIVPQVEPVPEMAPLDYLALIKRRFANPQIRDTARRVAFDGSARHPGFLLPVLRERLAAGAPVSGLALTQALWARMCAGQREDGDEIAPNDPHWDSLKTAALQARDAPLAWLDQAAIYGDLTEAEAFSEHFAKWLSMIWAEGTQATLATYTGTR
ncbi:MAG: mannitol dehydrogenase family protein [Pseudomonadota bacterium]